MKASYLSMLSQEERAPFGENEEDLFRFDASPESSCFLAPCRFLARGFFLVPGRCPD